VGCRTAERPRGPPNLRNGMTQTGFTTHAPAPDALDRDDLRRICDNIACSVLALVALGLLMAYSVSAARAPNLAMGYKALFKQGQHIAVSMAALLFFARLDYRLLARWRWHIFLGAVALLALVLAPGVGTMRNGARRWFRLAGFSFQPSEVAKMGLLVALAAYAADRRDDLERFFGGLLPGMALVGITSMLVLVEPDFGTAALLGAVGTVVLVVAGARVCHVLALGLPAIGGLVYLVCQSPMRLERILAFIDPWRYYDGAGYQVIQSLVALGRGGWLGQGLGASVQKLYFLPEAGSDFVLAVVGEEMGALGALGVLAFYALLVVEGMRVSGRAKDTFGSLLAFGIACTIGLQAAINVAVVTASVPTKGIALPFISAGGSSLLFNMAGVGVLFSIARRAGAHDGPARLAAGPAQQLGGSSS